MLSKFTFEKEIEAFAVEINLRKVKWLLVGSYNPIFSNSPVHLNVIYKAIEFYSKTYDKILKAGDFNAQVSDIKLATFCSIWNLKCLGKEPTCFKNLNNLSCIDLFLINTIRNFQETQVFKTGLSDLHKLVVTVLKSAFPKSPPKIIYRGYKNYSNDLNDYLQDDLNSLQSRENMNFEITGLTSFTKIFTKILNRHAPMKKKYALAKHTNFATKDLRKAVMLRSRLRNIFLKPSQSLIRLTTNNAIFALLLLKKLRNNTFKTLTYQILLTTRSFGQLEAPYLAKK